MEEQREGIAKKFFKLLFMMGASYGCLLLFMWMIGEFKRSGIEAVVVIAIPVLMLITSLFGLGLLKRVKRVN